MAGMRSAVGRRGCDGASPGVVRGVFHVPMDGHGLVKCHQRRAGSPLTLARRNPARTRAAAGMAGVVVGLAGGTDGFREIRGALASLVPGAARSFVRIQESAGYEQNLQPRLERRARTD